MREVDIDLSPRRPKPLSRVAIEDVELLINLSDEKIHVVSDGLTMESWALPDPTIIVGTEQDILDEFRSVRDELRTRIEGLARRSAPTSDGHEEGSDLREM
jgi:arsenate reductase